MRASTVLKDRLNQVTADLAAGHRTRARDTLRELVSSYPDDAHVHNAVGILRAGDNDIAGAVASFQRAAALKPGFGEAHYNLGLALCQNGKFTLAEESLRKALETDSGNAAYYVVLGNAVRQQGKLEEAVVAYQRALDIGGVPEFLLRTNLGGVLLELNHVDAAVQSFLRARDLQPNSGTAHFNLGSALRRQGRLNDAIASFRSAVAYDRTAKAPALALANTLRDVGKFEEAVAAYKAVLSLSPDDKQAAYHLGLTLLDLGRTAEGMRAIDAGPGVARITCVPPRPSKPLDRITIGQGDTPTFIGAWSMQNPDLCDRIIAYFDQNAARAGAGRTGSGIDTSAKDSTDLTVLPCEIQKPGYEPVAEYLAHLEMCYADYAAQWPFLGGILPQGEIMPFTIQRYATGGHFQNIHSERSSSSFAHRVLAWMSYLDDVEEGGETRFHHYGIAVRPERGKTLIWPAEWTHAHSGGVVRRGSKHVITGWIHFPVHATRQRPVD